MTAFVDELRKRLPVRTAPYRLPERAGLIVIDAIHGFCTPGAGTLAPPAPDARIDGMVGEIERTARAFLASGRPVFAFRDTHEPSRPEPPYPPHCERGSGEELFVPPLAFLKDAAGAVVIEKDVINPYIGAIGEDGSNRLVDWMIGNRLEAVVVTGICTDICDLDLVVTLLSARNHHVGSKPMLEGLKDVVVYEPACATFELPGVHPQAEAHHIGLYVMQSRGAVIADALESLA